MQQTHFENLYQVETIAIKMLRAAKETNSDCVTIESLKAEIPDLDDVSDLVKKLAFLEVNEESF